MTGPGLLRLMGYSVSALAVFTGVLMLAGWVLGMAPSGLRVTFGIVLIFYGIYRFLLVRMSARRRERQDAEPGGREPGPSRGEGAGRWERPGRWEREDRWTRDRDTEE